MMRKNYVLKCIKKTTESLLKRQIKRYKSEIKTIIYLLFDLQKIKF